MAIQSIQARRKLPILGKIRLGVRKEARSGSLYPSTVEYFVLDDAPGVADVYGSDPKALDIIFPMDSLEDVIPTWFKWYSAGRTNKDGDAMGGKLNCYGNGPGPDGAPGVAHYLAQRDPVTKVVPTRPCLGEQCPDWRSTNGQQQCKQMMRVFCILPRVSLYGVYQIDTSSWRSIHSFHDQLNLVATLNSGVIKMIPFMLVREEETTTFYDTKSKKDQTGRQFIMRLKPNERFFELHGEDVKKKISAFSSAQFVLGQSRQELLEAPTEDLVPSLPEGDSSAEVPQVDPIQMAESVLANPEVIRLFTELEQLMGKQFPHKARMLSVRRREREPNVLQVVIDELKGKIAELSAKQAAAPAEPAAPEAPSQMPPVEVLDGSGIM